MTTLRTAAQQALDALYRWHMTDGETAELMPAFEALRAALAEPQRKPLTEEEIEQAHRHIYRRLPYEFDHSTPSWVEQGIRYAERAHGIGGQDA